MKKEGEKFFEVLGQNGVFIDESTIFINPLTGEVTQKLHESEKESKSPKAKAMADPLSGEVKVLFLPSESDNDHEIVGQNAAAPPSASTNNIQEKIECAAQLDEMKQKAKSDSENSTNSGPLTSYEAMQKLRDIIPIRVVDEGVYAFNKIIYEYLTNPKINRLILQKLRFDVEKSHGCTNYVNDIRRWILIEPDLVMEPPKNTDLVAFHNGILNLRTGVFSKPSSKYFFTSYVNVDYDPDACEDTPVFDEFLHRTFAGNPDLIERVWEVLGYLLTSDMNAKRFVLLQGVGDSGKSLLGRFFASFFTKDSISSVDIFTMGDRFSLFDLVGKRLNASFDLPSGKLNVQAVSVIKQLTGGDLLRAEPKYENGFSFENSCKLVFATNHPIRLAEADEAFESRCLIIPFRYSVPRNERDFFLMDKFELEKNGIAKKALAAYCRLRDRNYCFSGENHITMHVPPLLSEESIVEDFLHSKCEFTSMDTGTFTFILHDAFIEFCILKNLPYPNIVKFSELIKKIGGDYVKHDKWRDSNVKSGAQNGYRGIILKK